MVVLVGVAIHAAGDAVAVRIVLQFMVRLVVRFDARELVVQVVDVLVGARVRFKLVDLVVNSVAVVEERERLRVVFLEVLDEAQAIEFVVAVFALQSQLVVAVLFVPFRAIEQSVRRVGEVNSLVEPFYSFRGLPRGRTVDSRPSCFTFRLLHCSVP